MILVTTPGNVRPRSHSAARSRSSRPQPGQGSPGCGPVAEIAALIDAGELRLDISEHGLLRDTAAIHERAEAGDLRGRVVLVPEG
jgi:NADPH:quinone reductase-like Zn-dependent oxidoreductase